jgi:signal transduction histidine kinase
MRHLAGMPDRAVFDPGAHAPRIVDNGDAVTLLLPGRQPIALARPTAPENLTAVLQLATELTDLRREVEALQDADSAGLLASIIAHDANSLLTLMLVNAQALARRSDADGAAMAGEIAEGCRRIGTMLHRLGATGRRPGAPAVLVNAIITELKGTLSRLAAGAAVVTMSCEHPMPGAWIHPTDLERVLVNLVANARDAMTARGEIAISTQLVSVAPGEADGIAPGRWVLLTVEDDGCGMDEATLRRATEPFFTTKPPGCGSGLGLASAARAVRAAGGHLRIESAPGAGTRVRIWLSPASTDTLPPPP